MSASLAAVWQSRSLTPSNCVTGSEQTATPFGPGSNNEEAPVRPSAVASKLCSEHLEQPMADPTRVTVVVADDHPVTRQGVVRALKSSGRVHVVAEVADGRAALDAIRQLRPAVALLDYKMPELDGLEVTHAITRDGLPTHVVLLSAFDDSSVVYKALAEGASGYLTKESDSDEIVNAVVKCASGDAYLPTGIAGGLASEVKRRARGATTLLTERESQVVKMMADGMSVPQIASQLHLATSTVKTHVQSLYEKLGVSDRGAAVAEAMRRRLLE
ncbi:putative transcriptional regulatory protein NarL [Mycobacterium simulans]|nr:putative transcriptional regulatory protein NarL [Mycobacterium simulans]